MFIALRIRGNISEHGDWIKQKNIEMKNYVDIDINKLEAERLVRLLSNFLSRDNDK